MINCINHIFVSLLGVTLSPRSASLDVNWTLGCTLLGEGGSRGGHGLSLVLFTTEAFLYPAGSVPVVNRKLEVKKVDRKVSSLILPPSLEIIHIFLLINVKVSSHLKCQIAYLCQAAILTVIW